MSKSKRIPAVRFGEFFGKWRKFSIDEIMAIRKETGNQNDYSIDVELENLVSDMGVLVGDLSIRTQSNSIFRKEDILFGRLRPYLNKWWLSNTEGIKSGEIWAFYPLEKNSSVFLYSLIQTHKFLAVANTSSGTKMPRSDWNNLSNLVVDIPQFKEQQKIGLVFKQLDDTIVLQQQLVEQQQRYKKAMLQKMFPRKGKLIPEIRFDGFSREWEDLKIKDIGTVVMCKRIFKDQTSSTGEIPFYKIGTFGGVADSFIPRELFTEYKQRYPYPEKGDILISASGTIGRMVVFTGKDEYFQDSNIIWIKKDKDKVVNSFLKQFYNVVDWGSFEGSTIKRLYNSNILSTNISLPSLEEQQKIGSFFKHLDDTIDLHQKKLEETQQLKKALLQRIFV